MPDAPAHGQHPAFFNEHHGLQNARTLPQLQLDTQEHVRTGGCMHSSGPQTQRRQYFLWPHAGFQGFSGMSSAMESVQRRHSVLVGQRADVTSS
jgi:hypothetical protein